MCWISHSKRPQNFDPILSVFGILRPQIPHEIVDCDFESAIVDIRLLYLCFLEANCAATSKIGILSGFIIRQRWVFQHDKAQLPAMNICGMQATLWINKFLFAQSSMFCNSQFVHFWRNPEAEEERQLISMRIFGVMACQVMANKTFFWVLITSTKLSL